MKRAKWYLGLLLVGTLLVVGGCTEEPSPPVLPIEPTGYSDISIPIEEFQNQPHIDVVMHGVVGGELTVTLGSNPTTGYQWSDDAEISDKNIVEQTSYEFVGPGIDEPPGTPGEEVWTFKALERGTVTILLEYSRLWDEDARYRRRTIITVDETSINMDYFLRRTRLAGADPIEMLEVLTNELLIKVEAPRYVAEVSPEDIDQALRRIASGESETISESEFKEWYRQLLNEIDLSDSGYREIVTTNLLAARLHEYLAERVPTVAEQVHLYTLLLGTEDMDKIMERERAGEDLGELTTEIWQNKQSEGTIEDLGWLPRGIIISRFDEVAFNLSIGNVSEVVEYIADPTAEGSEVFYYLLMVSEKAAAREVDEDSLQILKAKALDNWLLAEIKFHEIGWYGLKNGFDSETLAWIDWQLAKDVDYWTVTITTTIE